MEADSIYMNVYRNDERTNKELLSNNSNFVCFVDYNVDGITSLVNGAYLNLFGKLFITRKLVTVLSRGENKDIVIK